MKTVTTTIEKSQHEIALRWARKHPEVVELAKVDLAYRCNLWAAESKEYKKFLVRQARQRLAGK
jgi:hypothetical protein